MDFYANSPYKKVSNLTKGVNYVFTNDDTPNSDEIDSLAVNETSEILIPNIGYLAVIKYLFNKKKCLTHQDLIQEIVREEFQILFLKKACKKSFTVKSDTDLIAVNFVMKIVTDGDFSMKTNNSTY